MNIIHIIESFGSGTLQIVRSIVEASHEAGFKTTVFHGMRDETPPNYSALFPAETRLIQLKTGRQVNGIFDAYDSIRIAAYAVLNKIDVIHGHSSKGGALARMAGLLTGIPNVYTPHGFSFLTETGADTSKLTYRIESMLGKLPCTLVCCSESEASIASKFCKHVKIIANFVDKTEIVDFLRSSQPAEPCDVITAGRVSWQKNAPLFMDVARKMPHLKFTWAGGPFHAVGTDVPGNVTITGWIPREEALRRMSASRVFLSTSRFEGMPIAMLEAQALGMPVVTTNVLGSRDIITNNVNGILANTVDEIVWAISSILDHVDIVEGMKSASLSNIDISHNRETILASWLDFYRSF